MEQKITQWRGQSFKSKTITGNPAKTKVLISKESDAVWVIQYIYFEEKSDLLLLDGFKELHTRNGKSLYYKSILFKADSFVHIVKIAVNAEVDVNLKVTSASQVKENDVKITIPGITYKLKNFFPCSE